MGGLRGLTSHVIPVDLVDRRLRILEGPAVAHIEGACCVLQIL